MKDSKMRDTGPFSLGAIDLLQLASVEDLQDTGTPGSIDG
jgi:hypothetical protein